MTNQQPFPDGNFENFNGGHHQQDLSTESTFSRSSTRPCARPPPRGPTPATSCLQPSVRVLRPETRRESLRAPRSNWRLQDHMGVAAGVLARNHRGSEGGWDVPLIGTDPSLPLRRGELPLDRDSVAVGPLCSLECVGPLVYLLTVEWSEEIPFECNSQWSGKNARVLLSLSFLTNSIRTTLGDGWKTTTPRVSWRNVMITFGYTLQFRFSFP